MRDSLRDIKRSEMVEEIRFRFTRYLHKVYWELYEHGELSEESIQVLSESCGIANDEVGEGFRFFEVLSSNFTMDTMKFYMKFKDTPLVGSKITEMLIQKIYFIYEITTTFIEACDETLHVFEHSFPLHT